MISCDRGVQLEWYQKILGRVREKLLSCFRLIHKAVKMKYRSIERAPKKESSEFSKKFRCHLLIATLLVPVFILRDPAMHRLWADTYQETNTPTRVFKKGDQLCRWEVSHVVCLNNIIERLE